MEIIINSFPNKFIIEIYCLIPKVQYCQERLTISNMIFIMILIVDMIGPVVYIYIYVRSRAQSEDI